MPERALRIRLSIPVKLVWWLFFHHAIFITLQSLHHPWSDGSGSFWWEVSVSSQRDEGFILHFPLHIGQGYTRGYSFCQSCPSWSGRVGSTSALLSYSLMLHPQYVVDCTDGSLTIVMLTSAPLLPSLPLSAKSAKFLEQLCSAVPLEWKLVAAVSVSNARKTSWPLLYIYKERWFTLKIGQVRSCKWDFAHKVTNETLVCDLSLLLAPSLGHFFNNCSLLARHTSLKITLFFFQSLCLSKELYSYGLLCSWNIVS